MWNPSGGAIRVRFRCKYVCETCIWRFPEAHYTDMSDAQRKDRIGEPRCQKAPACPAHEVAAYLSYTYTHLQLQSEVFMGGLRLLLCALRNKTGPSVVWEGG